MIRRALLVLVVSLVPALAWPAIESRQFDTPEHETRYYDLIHKLRCLVCQNQNLADSNAELAADLREKTYEMVLAGQSDEEITDFMVSRYGEFVLYEPPFDVHTMLLWWSPVLLGLVGAGVFYGVVRRRRIRKGPEISDDQLESARRLLNTRNDS